jgi:tetratricopeptide (TPR) repeat protein
MCSHRADLAIRRSQYRNARTWAQKGLSLTAPLAATAVEVRGKLLLDDAAALHFMGRNAESLRLATEALAAATQARSPYLEGLAHLHLEMVHSVLIQTEAHEHGDAAVRIFESIGHDRYLADALINSGLTAMNEGRWNEALNRYQRAAEVAARTGDPTEAAIIELNQGFLLLRQGRYAEADAHGLRALRSFDTGELELSGAYARHLRSRVAAAEGRFTEAEALMDAARSAFVRYGDHAMVVDCDVASMDRLLRADRIDDVIALAAAIEPEIGNADETVDISFWLILGIAEARTGDTAGGAARIARALDTASTRELLYEEYLCLLAFIDIENDGGPAAPADARSKRGLIATSLGLVTPPLKAR